MGLLSAYRGTYCSAESASSKIDAEAIIAGCNAVDAEAAHISEYSNLLSQSGSNLTERVLSANGVTMEGKVDEYCTNIKSVESYILNSTAQIREAAEAVYNQIQDQMNQEAHAKDEYEYNRRRNGG